MYESIKGDGIREKNLDNVINTLGFVQNPPILDLKNTCNKKNSQCTMFLFMASLHIFSLKFSILLQNFVICWRGTFCFRIWILIVYEDIWVVFHAPHQLETIYIMSQQ
ncbi:hypothetical protein V8G54_029196 [Vigna mungo]|uniref:Uncharacterized protein n=1 Tax=Vigna mungo TaxID=3915 RepID=A0AAQ3RME1_VIGMU